MGRLTVKLFWGILRLWKEQVCYWVQISKHVVKILRLGFERDFESHYRGFEVISLQEDHIEIEGIGVDS